MSRWLSLRCLLLTVAAWRLVQPTAGNCASPEEAPHQAAAVVNGAPITIQEVERQAQRAVSGRTDDFRHPALLAAALEVLINKRLANEFLAEQKRQASEADVQAEINRLQSQLAQQGQTLDAHLASQQLSLEEFRTETAWRISWRRYLDSQMTDANLARFFAKRRAHFDGSQRKVAHILFQDPAQASPADRKQTLELAKSVRQQIESGRLSFADAARKHSAAPTAESGGVIGLISRDQPMPEAFSQAAFDLPVGQVSEPVRSPFGIHLIVCLEELPGERTWEQARPQLREAVSQYLFQWAADRQRGKARIEFTGASPYFRPEDRELVVPE